MKRTAGRHFLQIPGPTNVPDRVLRAIDFPTMYHRGPDFAELGKSVLEGMKRVFKTAGDVVIYPASGTGAWEAALVNTLSAGDPVLMYETGHFATLWQRMAVKLGLQPEFLGGDWRTGADPAAIEKGLRADTVHRVKAVCVVHSETSTGVTLAFVRRAGRPTGVFTLQPISQADQRFPYADPPPPFLRAAFVPAEPTPPRELPIQFGQFAEEFLQSMLVIVRRNGHLL